MKPFILLFTSFNVWAATVDLSTTKNKVEFLAIGQPSALKINGKPSDGKASLDGKLDITKEGLSGAASFQLNQLSTGLEMRDTHMKDKYLETATYPVAQLKFKAVPINKEIEKSDYKHKDAFEGELTLHGVTQKVKGTLELTKSESKWKGLFHFGILLEDYKIQIPNYLGIKVAKEVKLEVGFEQ